MCLTQITSIPSSMSLRNPPLRSGWLHSPASLKNPYLGLRASQTGFSPFRFPLLCSSLSSPLACLRVVLWAQDPPPVPHHTKFAASFFHLHCSSEPCLSPYLGWVLPFLSSRPLSKPTTLSCFLFTGHSQTATFSPLFSVPHFGKHFSHLTKQLRERYHTAMRITVASLSSDNQIVFFFLSVTFPFLVDTTNLKYQVTAHC